MNCVTICCYSEKQCTRRTILKVKILGKTIKKMIQSSLLLGAMVCTINGCSFLDPGGLQENTEAIHTGAVTIVPGTYDSEDTAIVLYCSDIGLNLCHKLCIYLHLQGIDSLLCT